MRHQLREPLPALPDRMKDLPVSAKGYPVPYFVKYIDGVPDFRVMDEEKYARCLKNNVCWCCGKPLGRYKAFVGGPLVAINKISAEPPLHRDCAEFSVQACPFLLLPKAKRRDTSDVTIEVSAMGGMMLDHNPTVTAMYMTASFKVTHDANGLLLRMGDPTEVIWYTNGRIANREEVIEAMERSVEAAREKADARQMRMTEENYTRALQRMLPG
jgi:hypothetical protein